MEVITFTVNGYMLEIEFGWSPELVRELAEYLVTAAVHQGGTEYTIEGQRFYVPELTREYLATVIEL